MLANGRRGEWGLRRNGEIGPGPLRTISSSSPGIQVTIGQPTASKLNLWEERDDMRAMKYQ